MIGQQYIAYLLDPIQGAVYSSKLQKAPTSAWGTEAMVWNQISNKIVSEKEHN